MIEIIIMLWVWLCPNPNHTIENHGKCRLIHTSSSFFDTETNGDTGGETGNPPPPPPPPPREG